MFEMDDVRLLGEDSDSEDEDEKEKGFCFTYLYEKGEGSVFVSLLHGVTLIGCCSTLVYWIVSQHRLRSNNGFYSGTNAIIFPVHLRVLLLLAFALFYWGIVVIYFSIQGDRDSTSYIFLEGTSFGLKVGVQAGITFLLLSPGIGRQSLRRAAFFSAFFFVFAAAVITLSNFFADADDDGGHDGDLAGDVDQDDPVGLSLKLFYHYFLALVYLFLWLAPARMLFVTRRPAALAWTRYLALTESALTAAFTLTVLSVDAGFCIYSFVENIVYTLFLCSAAFYAFVLEANFWHGIHAEASGADCALILFPCCATTATGVFQGASSLFEEPTAAAAAAGAPPPSSSGSPVQINAPFQGGVELSSASGRAMSMALDALERSTASPAMGSSSSRTFLGARARRTSKLLDKFRSSGRTGKTAVRLIDFSRLTILPDRMLGTGSTARVYEGRWCGKKCAVKVLFTVEITPEEIHRTCLEASLLNTLQGSSAHVIRLFGVAVLPPSLCVVLELCSEGSLNDVLYRRKDPLAESEKKGLMFRGLHRNRSSRHLISTSSSSASLYQQQESESRFNVRTSLFRGSVDDGHSVGSRQRSRGSTSGSMTSNPMLALQEGAPEFVYALPWERRLELAIGASRGVASLAASLDGLSHNDIKSSNFLVHRPDDVPAVGTTPEFVFEVKIADMEYASQGKTPAHMAPNRPSNILTPHWCAPEVLSGDGPVSPASDVYALAVVLFEIGTRSMPFTPMAHAEVERLVKQGSRPEFPATPELDLRASETAAAALGAEAAPPSKAAQEAVFELASRARYQEAVQKAWSQDPAHRPSASEVASELEKIRLDFYADREAAKSPPQNSFERQAQGSTTVEEKADSDTHL